MKLAKALKEKNRLGGEVKRLKDLIQRENSKNVKSTSKVDCAKLWADLEETVRKLINIKTAIFKANAGIYNKITTIGEYKSKVEWIKSLNTKDGVEDVPNYRGESTKTEQYVAFVKQEEVDQMIVNIQESIAMLQDDLDAYNATTEIEL
jgi:hypothetical protein